MATAMSLNFDLSSLPSRPAKSPLRLKQSTSTSSVRTTSVDNIRQAIEAIQDLGAFTEDRSALATSPIYPKVIDEDGTTSATPKLSCRSIHFKRSSLPFNWKSSPLHRNSQNLGSIDIETSSFTMSQTSTAVVQLMPRCLPTRHAASDAATADLKASLQRAPNARVMPEVRVTEPSMPPGSVLPPSILPVHPFAAVVALMEDGDSPRRALNPSKGKQRAVGERLTGIQQRATRYQTGPGSVIGRMSSRDSLTRLARKASGLYKQGTGFLRPAPPIPAFPQSINRYNPSHPRLASPSSTPIALNAQSSTRDDVFVEIPRFKKRELNLAIVARRTPWRVMWVFMWACWVTYGVISLFFDVNLVYILVQCSNRTAVDASNGKNWIFATTAYIICCLISTLVIWLGWEVGYEWWRRWRLPRPAIEPIYLSLPATVHLSLASYAHFVFLAHIRCSSLGTPFALDAIFETCYLLVQLAPGLVPLLPRAAIGIVVLLSFSSASSGPQAPSDHTDVSRHRDPHFFRDDSPDQLTLYARCVSIAFVACVGIRLGTVLLASVGLWVAPARPSGNPTARTSAIPHQRRPITRDPSTTVSPRKTLLFAETEFDWAWRDRTRSRIQDAFELCMIRRDMPNAANLTMPWGRSASSLPVTTSHAEVSVSAGDFLAHFVGQSVSEAIDEPARRELHIEDDISRMSRPPSARGDSPTLPPDYSQELFNTPRNTPVDRFEGTAVTEVGARQSDDFGAGSADDSTALLSSVSSPRPSREVLSDCHSARHTSIRRRASSTASASGRALSRARSTSASLLSRSVNSGLVKRARSGTVLSAQSAYSQVDDDYKLAEELARATMPRKRSKLGALGSGHPVLTDMRSSTT